MDKIKVGARGSKLSVIQAKRIIEILERMGFRTEFIPITTKGDMVKNKPLFKIKGVGIFVKEIERALLNGIIDIAVHSAKDVPTKIDEDFEIICFLKREEVNDVVIGYFSSLNELKEGALVGTSSIRRREFLKEKRKDLVIKDLRGNIDTRIKKWREGMYDAIVVSEVAIKRLKIDVPYFRLDLEEFPPAPGQGAICVEAKRDFKFKDVLKEIGDKNTEIEVMTERFLLSKLGVGCGVPFGCYAEVKNGKIKLIAKYKRGDNFKRVKVEGTSPEETAMKAYELLLE